MGKIIYSFCKDGVRIDRPLDEIEKGGPGSGRKPEGGTKEDNQANVPYDKYIAAARRWWDREFPGAMLHPEDIASKTAQIMSRAGIKISAEHDKLIRERLAQTKMLKQEPIATDEPVISEGAIVTLNGHKGKVISMLGGKAQVSWEDASISEVDAKDLGYAGRVEKGGAGSGRYAEEVKANNVKLHVVRHLRRQGKLSRMKKGGPGSGRRPYGSGEKMPKDFGERTRQPGGMDRLLGQARMPRKEIKATARAIFNSWKAKPENQAFLASKAKIKADDRALENSRFMQSRQNPYNRV